jgi:hypothetical protein
MVIQSDYLTNQIFIHTYIIVLNTNLYHDKLMKWTKKNPIQITRITCHQYAFFILGVEILRQYSTSL